MAPYSGANWFVYATPGHILAAGAALPAVSILVVALRFYTRMMRQSARDRRRSPFGIDDYLILPALALVIGMGIALIIGKPYRYGWDDQVAGFDVDTRAFLQAWRRKLLDMRHRLHQAPIRRP